MHGSATWIFRRVSEPLRAIVVLSEMPQTHSIG
jgi:hypothetical protein